MIKTYKNINISVGYQCFCMKPSEQGSWVQIVICYDQNLQKHKYLSRISMLLHKSWLILLSRSKWVQIVQIVVCYDRNLQKHKYLSRISTFLHKTFRTGLVFLSQSKWVQIVVCYDQNLQKHKYLSTISTFLLQNLQNRAHFSEPVEMSPNSGMLWSSENVFWAGWNEFT